jgi:hypothetical protein
MAKLPFISPDSRGLDKPIVWLFPKLAVCLECGFTQFTVPERELSVLVRGTAVEGEEIIRRQLNGA